MIVTYLLKLKKLHILVFKSDKQYILNYLLTEKKEKEKTQQTEE